MKKTRTPKTRTAPTAQRFNPADHLPRMLLAGIHGGSLDPRPFQSYLDAARAILASPNAFDEGADTVEINSFVLGDEVWTRWSPELGQLLRRIMDDADDHEPITARSGELRGVIYSLISETSLFGAAVMHELLKGGAR